MAENYKMELDKVKEYLGEAGKDSLRMIWLYRRQLI